MSIRIAFAALLLSMPAGRAIPAPFVPDERLAAYPVIVMASWKGAPFEARHKIEGDVLKEWEVRTEISIHNGSVSKETEFNPDYVPPDKGK